MSNRNKGFISIKLIILIIIIIVIFIVMVMPRFMPRFVTPINEIRKGFARANISTISEALEMYKKDNGCYPTTEQGLKALVEKPLPSPSNWNGPYLKHDPIDPWQKYYQYRCPSQNGQPDFDLWSLGRDGNNGTDDDITNWAVKR